jgi:hypothetical protein
MENLNQEELIEWKNNYLRFMKTVTYANNGKKLLIKNPANTARINVLHELFPDAKFIHIYRNPYKVYFSTIKMRNRVLDKLALQNANENEIEKQVIKNYQRLMNSFFKQKKQIQKDRLVEIKYEDLVKNPIKQIKEIYSKLNIKGLETALPEMNKYLERQKNYKTNVYKIDKKIIKHIQKEWEFTLKLWDYKPPS